MTGCLPVSEQKIGPEYQLGPDFVYIILVPRRGQLGVFQYFGQVIQL